MTFPTWLTYPRRLFERTRPVNRTCIKSAAVASLVVTPIFDDIVEARDLQLLTAARMTLDDQVRELIDRNADGINHAALQLRRETDLLLSLGISDPFAAKAAAYAQMALGLANAGRGRNLDAEPHQLTPAERAEPVARAMTLVLRAQMLMAAAKQNNVKHIEDALARQEQRLQCARATLLGCHTRGTT